MHLWLLSPQRPATSQIGTIQIKFCSCFIPSVYPLFLVILSAFCFETFYPIISLEVMQKKRKLSVSQLVLHMS